MVIKVVKGGRELIYPCDDHTESEKYPDRLDIELHYLPPRKTRTISLPKDGDVAYIEDNGRTVSVKRWEGNGSEDGASTGNDLTNRPVTFRG